MTGDMRSTALALMVFAMLAPFVSRAETVAVDGGAGLIEVPAPYRYEFEDRGKTLVLFPANPREHQIRFSFHSVAAEAKQRPTIGKDFVRAVAKKDSLPIFDVAPNGGVAFQHPPKSSTYRGVKVQDSHGALGLDDAWVTFTVSIAESEAETPAMKELASIGIRKLLGRIQSRKN